MNEMIRDPTSKVEILRGVIPMRNQWLFSMVAAAVFAASPAMACDEGDVAEVAATICGTIVGDALAGPVGAVIVGTRAAEAAREMHTEYHRQTDPAPVPDLAPIPDMQLRSTFGGGGGGGGGLGDLLILSQDAQS